MSSYSTDMYRTLSFANDEVVTIEDNTHTFEMLIIHIAGTVELITLVHGVVKIPTIIMRFLVVVNYV